MDKGSINSELLYFENVQDALSQFSFELWSSEQAAEYVAVPGCRIVNLYNVVHSVIENDFTPAEREAALRCWFEGKSAAVAAAETGTSKANIYKALNRGKEKIRLVLKHIINCEEYKKET